MTVFGKKVLEVSEKFNAVCLQQRRTLKQLKASHDALMERLALKTSIDFINAPIN